MSAEDKLPVLAFARPARPAASATPPPAAAPQRQRRAALPADLARAIAALQGALEAELCRPRAQPDLPARASSDEAEEDSFSPVGEPRARPGMPRPHAITRRGEDEDKDPLARRLTAIHLPRFAIERWLRLAERQGEAVSDEAPLALAVEGPHGPVIHDMTRAAAQAGVVHGARVVDMRALCPGLRVEFADPGAERAALARLMLWARRWCPWSAVDGMAGGAAGLMLDTTGSDHLWGGEAGMLREIEARLATLGLGARLACAPTQGAAWALARLSGPRAVCGAAELPAQVAPLPVRALRLGPDTVLLLQRLGLKTVGDLAAVPRISLARRFSRAAPAENPLMRLDQMMGRLAEPLASPDDPPRFAVEARLAEPVQDPGAWLPGLCEELCAALAAAGFGARRLTLTVYRSDGEVSSLGVATARPSRDPAHLRRLFDDRLERIEPGFGFDLITLDAPVAEDMSAVQRRLDGGVDAEADLARLIDRLSARLGAGAVRRPAPGLSHIPERREGWQPALAGGTTLPPTPAPPGRPLRLFSPPEEVRVVYAVPEGPPAQFIWRRVTHRVARFAGPERIAPEWWADRPGTRLRDYWRIEDEAGRRFWIYREGVLGDGRGDVPRWFVHGAFA